MITRPIKNIILPGQVFGRLTVVRREDKFERDGCRRRSYFCHCICGGQKVIKAENLLSGGTKSCGCLHKEMAIARLPARTHGACGTALYKIVEGIYSRCTNPNNQAFKNYGARGITVFEEWRDPGTFIAYIKNKLGPRPSDQHSIDRINNDKGYEPGNIRWATPKEQSANRRKVGSLERFSTSEILQELERRKIRAVA